MIATGQKPIGSHFISFKIRADDMNMRDASSCPVQDHIR